MAIPNDLLDGYRRFRSERFAQEADRYRQLAGEQRPATMVIGCADSRVDPATILGAAPGELFVVRNVAALVPPCEEHGAYHGTSAAVEFAVTGLRVSRILVLGHGRCGGVAAALARGEQLPVGRFIGPWVELLAAPRDKVVQQIQASHADQRQRALERLAIVQSIANLASFPFVAQAVSAGQLRLEGAWFSIGDGVLEWLNRDAGVFEPVPA